MTDIDADIIIHALWSMAKDAGNFAPAQLRDHLEWLVEAQDELARAIEKARSPERLAA